MDDYLSEKAFADWFYQKSNSQETKTVNLVDNKLDEVTKWVEDLAKTSFKAGYRVGHTSAKQQFKRH
jgi:hypothetical protein